LETTILAQLNQVTESTFNLLVSWMKGPEGGCGKLEQAEYFSEALKDSNVSQAARKSASQLLAEYKRIVLL